MKNETTLQNMKPHDVKDLLYIMEPKITFLTTRHIVCVYHLFTQTLFQSAKNVTFGSMIYS